MLEIGKVIKVTGKEATVRIDRNTACGHCTACGMSSDKKFIDIAVDNSLDAKVDDKVELKINEKSSLKVSLIVYLIPLFFAFLLVILGTILKLDDLWLVLLFVGGLAIGFVIVRFIDKKYSKKMDLVPEMTRIIKEDEKNE